MPNIVAGRFEQQAEADAAIAELMRHGFDRDQVTSFFVNPYAAMPSLHYGWAVLVGGMLFWTARNVWLRGFGLMMPVLQFTSILFTANHFILDALAGLGTALLGLLIAIALQEWGYPALRRLIGGGG